MKNEKLTILTVLLPTFDFVCNSVKNKRRDLKLLQNTNIRFLWTS